MGEPVYFKFLQMNEGRGEKKEETKIDLVGNLEQRVSQ